MKRAFNVCDNGKRFEYPYVHRSGRLEFPLEDPATALPGEGILWFDTPAADGAGWAYVLPVDLDPEPGPNRRADDAPAAAGS